MRSDKTNKKLAKIIASDQSVKIVNIEIVWNFEVPEVNLLAVCLGRSKLSFFVRSYYSCRDSQAVHSMCESQCCES